MKNESPTNKKFKWYEQPFRWANILLILLTLLAYLSSFINPKLSGWLSILGLAYPVLLFFNIGFLFFWIYRRKFTLAVSTFLCILIGWNFLTAIFGVNYFTTASTETTQQLSILTYNARNFGVSGNYTNEKRLLKIDETLAAIKEQEPDIFCGQETFVYQRNKGARELFKNNLSAYPHIVSKRNLLIASKYPIINQGKVEFEGELNKLSSNVFADVQFSNEFIVRVYSLHLESNQVSRTTENIELNTEKLQEKSTWRTIYQILKSIKENQKVRAEQIKSITEHIKGSPYPVIVCGDFNDTPLSYTVRQTNFLQDNFAKKGKGLGSTYNGNIPFLRIDYILSDSKFKVEEAKILRKHKASDHFPMVSTVSWEFTE